MADTGSESPPVSLRPWPAQDSSSEDLALQLRRLFEQRGHFRHITKESLQEDIANAKDGNVDLMQGVEEVDLPSVQDEKERRAEIMAAKVQMQQFIAKALNEARIVQDYLSLLVSRDSPKLADTTLSPYAKQHKLQGTLGYDKWPLPDPDSSEERKAELVAKGWRMKGLESAADNVLNAATRLETEVRKETQYWEQVLSIAQKGWSLRRIARDGHRPILGVQFGFSEASDQFKNRGFSPLRMDDNGSIILDPGLTQKPKVVRVRVQEDGRITGTSKLRSLDDITEPSIEDLIRRARDSLFEEELYHEMSLETRILLSYDVKMRDSVIHLPAPTTDGSKRIVLIDIIPLDQSLSEIDDHSSELFAQKVAEALRVLLSQIHRQRLYQRSQIPRPLSEQKKQSSPSPILSPLIEYFLGAQAVASVRDYTQQTKASLSSAGINVTTKLKFDGLSQLSQTFKVTATGRSPADHLVRSLTSPRTISVRISLPSSHKYPSDHDFLDIAVRTVVTAPTFGTEYTIFLPQSLAWTLPPQKSANRTFAFMSFTDLMSYFDLLVSLDLSTSVIAKTFSGWKPLEDVPRLRKPPGKPKSGDASSRQPEKLLRITMANKRLQLECVWKGAVERVEKYEWDGSAGVAKKSLEEVVAEWDVKP